MEILITAIAGVITGAIGSLMAPWANWGVEKKRNQQSRRATLIEETRKALNNPPSNQEFRDMDCIQGFDLIYLKELSKPLKEKSTKMAMK